MCVNDGGRGAYVLYLLKMWYSCFAQFSGIKCLAQTFPLTKIKISNEKRVLSDAYVRANLIKRIIVKLPSTSSQSWLKVLPCSDKSDSLDLCDLPVVVGDLWLEPCPGVGWSSTDSLGGKPTVDRGGVGLPWGWLFDWDFWDIVSPGSFSWMYPRSDLHCFQFISNTLLSKILLQNFCVYIFLYIFFFF